MKKEIIESYLQAGYALFPVNGKTPVTKNWQKTDHNPYQGIEDFPNNFGVCLKDDDLVIDIDVGETKNGRQKEGKESFRKLAEDISFDFKKTFAVKTGGGGVHFYLKKPPEIKIKEKWKQYPDIEFKSSGRFVVGAGCIHPVTKKEYKIVQGEMDNATQTPTILLNIIKYTPIDLEKLQGLKQYIDDVQTVARTKAFLTQYDAAIEGHGGDSHTYKAVCRCREFGISPQLALDLLLKIWNPKCQPPWDAEDLKQKVFNAYTYDESPLGSKHPETDFKDVKPKKKQKSWMNKYTWTGLRKKTTNAFPQSLNNTMNYLDGISKLNKLFRFNMHTQNIEFTRMPVWFPANTQNSRVFNWTDGDNTSVKLLLEKEQLYEVNSNTVHEAVYATSLLQPVHPIRDYLMGLKWDMQPRIETWLQDYAYVKDNAYTRAVSTKVMLAAVGRILNPGAPFHCVLILEGEQGIGKSMLINAFGGDWYGDVLVDPHKYADTVDNMRNLWIIELSEMEIAKKDVGSVRAFLSKATDRARLAYRRNTEDFPRQSIFIGSFNPDSSGGYLSDTTGNRRFWPVEVPIKVKNGVPEKYIRVAEFKENRDQLLAEAVYRYQRGETDLHIDNEVTKVLAAIEVDKRRPKDAWIDRIMDWLNVLNDDGSVKNVVSGHEVYTNCIGGVMSTFDRYQQSRVSQIMVKELKWIKGTYYFPSSNQNTFKIRKNGYKRPDNVDIEEIL